MWSAGDSIPRSLDDQSTVGSPTGAFMRKAIMTHTTNYCNIMLIRGSIGIYRYRKFPKMDMKLCFYCMSLEVGRLEKNAYFLF